MSSEENESKQVVTTSKLSPHVKPFVPRLAPSSTDSVVSSSAPSSLSPLVPEFIPTPHQRHWRETLSPPIRHAPPVNPQTPPYFMWPSAGQLPLLENQLSLNPYAHLSHLNLIPPLLYNNWALQNGILRHPAWFLNQKVPYRKNQPWKRYGNSSNDHFKGNRHRDHSNDSKHAAKELTAEQAEKTSDKPKTNLSITDNLKSTENENSKSESLIPDSNCTRNTEDLLTIENTKQNCSEELVSKLKDKDTKDIDNSKIDLSVGDNNVLIEKSKLVKDGDVDKHLKIGNISINGKLTFARSLFSKTVDESPSTKSVNVSKTESAITLTPETDTSSKPSLNREPTTDQGKDGNNENKEPAPSKFVISYSEKVKRSLQASSQNANVQGKLVHEKTESKPIDRDESDISSCNAGVHSLANGPLSPTKDTGSNQFKKDNTGLRYSEMSVSKNVHHVKPAISHMHEGPSFVTHEHVSTRAESGIHAKQNTVATKKDFQKVQEMPLVGSDLEDKEEDSGFVLVNYSRAKKNKQQELSAKGFDARRAQDCGHGNRWNSRDNDCAWKRGRSRWRRSEAEDVRGPRNESDDLRNTRRERNHRFGQGGEKKEEGGYRPRRNSLPSEIEGLQRARFTSQSNEKGDDADSNAKDPGTMRTMFNQNKSRNSSDNQKQRIESQSGRGKLHGNKHVTKAIEPIKVEKNITRNVDNMCNKGDEDLDIRNGFPALGNTSPQSVPSLMSYSAVLKSAPKPLSPSSVTSSNDGQQGAEEINGLDHAEDQSNHEQENGKKKKKKKQKKKLDSNQGQKSSSQKPTRVELDFSDVLAAALKAKSQAKYTEKVGRIPTSFSSPVKRATEGRVPHNSLDSTAPVIKRGKEREQPAKKKQSPLKKIILKEREEKKKSTDSSDETCLISEQDAAQESDIQVEEKEIVDEEELSEEEELDEVEEVEEKMDFTPEQIASQIHSRKFREYCYQLRNKEVDEVTSNLLKELVRFQDRQYQKDPTKAKIKRRFVLGLREVTKHLKVKKLKCVIISPNVERIKSRGGLDDVLNTIIALCQEQNIPVVFALGRQALGKALSKKVPVSVVGIFSYDGAQEFFKELLLLTEEAREGYKTRWSVIQDQMLQDLRLRQAAFASAEKTFDIVLTNGKEKKRGHSTGKENISENCHDNGCHDQEALNSDSLSGDELEFESGILNIASE